MRQIARAPSSPCDGSISCDDAARGRRGSPSWCSPRPTSKEKDGCRAVLPQGWCRGHAADVNVVAGQPLLRRANRSTIGGHRRRRPRSRRGSGPTRHGEPRRDELPEICAGHVAGADLQDSPRRAGMTRSWAVGSGSVKSHDGTPRYLLTPGAQCCSTSLDGGDARSPSKTQRLEPGKGDPRWRTRHRARGRRRRGKPAAESGKRRPPRCRGVRRPSRERSTLRAGTRADTNLAGGQGPAPRRTFVENPTSCWRLHRRPRIRLPPRSRRHLRSSLRPTRCCSTGRRCRGHDPPVPLPERRAARAVEKASQHRKADQPASGREQAPVRRKDDRREYSRRTASGTGRGTSRGSRG